MPIDMADTNIWACWWDDWHQRIEGIEARTEADARAIAARRRH